MLLLRFGCCEMKGKKSPLHSWWVWHWFVFFKKNAWSSVIIVVVQRFIQCCGELFPKLFIYCVEKVLNIFSLKLEVYRVWYFIVENLTDMTAHGSLKIQSGQYGLITASPTEFVFLLAILCRSWQMSICFSIHLYHTWITATKWYLIKIFDIVNIILIKKKSYSVSN